MTDESASDPTSVGAARQPNPTSAEAVEVTVHAEDVDLVSGLLWTTGIAALAEHPSGDGTVVLRTDVPAGGLDAVGAAVASRALATRVVRVDDGLDAWREHATVTRVGDRLVVHPPWVERGEVRPHDVVVELDPGRSWGHGAHPTSRLCLAEVERIVTEHPGCGVIDVGCGSGILAVAAAMLGAGWVEACDLDPAACEATETNARRNGVDQVVRVRQVRPERAADPLRAVERSGDLIVANIGAAALVEVAPRLLDRLAPGGSVVVSGLLDPAPPEVAAAFAPLRLVRTVAIDGWVVLTLA